MELEARLRAFAAIARRGSFSRAAEELYVSQPAVSKHLAALEAEVGKPLVVRGRGGAALTPAGELLAEYVLRAEALLANARRASRPARGGDRHAAARRVGHLRAPTCCPSCWPAFRERHPGVELDFELSTSAEALELVRAHRVELGVVGGRRRCRRSWRASRCSTTRSCSSGRPRSAAGGCGPKELEGLTWISRAEGSATRAAVETARLGAGPARRGRARAALLGGGQARGRQRSGHRRDQPARARPRARGGAARRARRPALAAVADDRGRPRPRRAADAARRALPRAPARVVRRGRAAAELEPARRSGGADRPRARARGAGRAPARRCAARSR